jgi:prepilin-type N-terminal cleavage/methylation domain-containing protein
MPRTAPNGPTLVRWLALVITGFTGVLLLSAAAGKSWEAPLFIELLRQLLPRSFNDRGLLVGLAAAVVAWECFCGCWLLLRPRSRWICRAAVVTLVAFSLVLVVLSKKDVPAGCGCIGLLRWAGLRDGSPWLGIVRNLGLICALGWVGSVIQENQRPAAATPEGNARSSRFDSGRGAFTLLELLVVIAVIAVLLALVVPTLVGARDRGRVARVLATHRQLLGAVSMYCEQNSGYLPYFATPGNPTGPTMLGGVNIGTPYFIGQSIHWASLIVPDYFGSRAAIEFDQSRDTTQQRDWPEQVVRSHYWMAHGAFAAPRYWEGAAPPADLSLFHGMRLSDAAYPSAKGLLIDHNAGNFASFSRPLKTGEPVRMLVGKVDGSADTLRWGEDSTSGLVSRPYGAVAWPVMGTEGGMAGRDF